MTTPLSPKTKQPTLSVGDTLYHAQEVFRELCWVPVTITTISLRAVTAVTPQGSIRRFPGIRKLNKRSFRMDNGLVKENEKAEFEWYREQLDAFDALEDLSLSYPKKLLVLALLHKTPLHKVPRTARKTVLRAAEDLLSQLQPKT